MASGSKSVESADLSQVRVVACDMDGTFLDSKHLPRPAGVAAVRAAEASGIHFCFATGRNRASAQNKVGMYFDLTKRSGIYMNGAIVYGPSGAVLQQHCVDAKLVRAIMAYASGKQIVALNLCSNDDFFMCNPKREMVQHLHEKYADPEPKLLKGGYTPSQLPNIHMVHVLTRPEDQDAAYEDVKKLVDKFGYRLCRNLPTDLAITNPNADKSLGVTALCTKLGFDAAKNALAIGDSGNDMGMVRVSAVGVAMKNARKDLRDIANVVTSANDDEPAGVVKVLQALPGVAASSTAKTPTL